MKSFLLITVLGVLLLGSGCETPSYSGSGPFRAVQPQVRTVSGDQKTVFYAAQKALKRMDFVLTRTRLARGQVEGISNLRDTVVFGAARQFELKVTLADLGANQTEVAVRLFEQSEADFKGGASNRALAEHGLYDSFFANLEQLLKESAKDGETTTP
ncbi:MAG: hypothetical protein K9M98_06410 [Cephaloticoccus sp.]|nr:hypothetical protein [Cephaloticoccus sp.]MCF7760119.1 hypothetical protein [Cephaloticoccus sp.]